MRLLSNICMMIIMLSFQMICANDPRFVFIVASYNNKRWYKKNLDSIFCQDYPRSHFRVIYINDVSTDGTGELVESYCKEKGFDHQCTIIHNQEKRLKVGNFYEAAQLCDDYEIMIELDGDDWLIDDKVLSILADEYKDPNVWMTYGQNIEDSFFERYKQTGAGLSSWPAKQLPKNVISANEIRDHKWSTCHMRSYYAWLFKRIKVQDLLDEEGRFYGVTGDLVMAFPMLEMAGYHSKFINRVLYVYNTHSLLSDYRLRPAEQVYTEVLIRKKKKYNPLEESSLFRNISPDHKIQAIIVSTERRKTAHLVQSLKKEHSPFCSNIVALCDTKVHDQGLVGLQLDAIKNVDFGCIGLVAHVIEESLDSNFEYTLLMNDVAGDEGAIMLLQEALGALKKTRSKVVIMHHLEEDSRSRATRLYTNVWAIPMKYVSCNNYFTSPFCFLYRTKYLKKNLAALQTLNGNVVLKSSCLHGLMLDTAWRSN